MSWLNALARPDILALKAYEHAPWEAGYTRLHANELPWRGVLDQSAAGLNRYPEPQPQALIERLAEIYRTEPTSILLTSGSGEAIDLLVRAFCRAGEDAVLTCPPTFALYELAARIQGARVETAPLLISKGFALNPRTVLRRCTGIIKLVFLCSPNNPTGNLLAQDAILEVIEELRGRALVVVDEAYLEFSTRASLASYIAQYPQLVVLRTLSKAHAGADPLRWTSYRLSL